MQLNFKLPSGFHIGTNLYRIDSEASNGKEGWRCTGRVFATIRPSIGTSNVLVDQTTFAPIRSHWDQEPLGVAFCCPIGSRT
jgi:hypothetical protein